MAKKKPKEGRAKGKFFVERVPTGVPGLDRLIEGGFVKGSTTLLAGGTGTGKTIFCCQFLLEGLKRGEKCLYLTLEESPQDIIGDVERFGWDFGDYVKSGRLRIEYRNPFELTGVSKGAFDHLNMKAYSRVAIDSTSVMGLYFKNPFEIRKQIFSVLDALKKSGATVLITAESPEDGRTLTKFGVEEYVTDGVVVLHYLGLGGSVYHSLQIRKMRRTNHGKDVYPMDITDRGILLRKA
ncbi:MAG: ATPase domain-containing protein [Candidatus Aenigmatarchaeota archaeon]